MKAKTRDKGADTGADIGVGKGTGFVPKPFTHDSDNLVEAAWNKGLADLPSRGIPLFALVDELASLSQTFHKKTLKPLGYTHADYAILATLLLNGGSMRPTFFTKMLDNASAATSQTLKKLESQGLLLRESSEEDKRSVLVGLTQKGKQMARTLCEAEAEQSFRVTKNLSNKELKELRMSLQKLITSLR